jgi:hypothetical protein
MNLRENIDRIHTIMGLNEVFDKCLPKDYRPGQTYDRDKLAAMFVCYTKNPKKFPIVAVREWLFPLLPDKTFQNQDPMDMFDGLQHHTLKQLAMAEDRDTRNIAIGVRSVSSMKFPQRMEEWLEWKKNQPMYQERLEYQLNKIRENNYNTLVVTPPNSPMVFEVVDSELWLQEGWHRLMAILELIKLGEISSEQAKAYVVNVFRNSGFKKNIVYK